MNHCAQRHVDRYRVRKPARETQVKKLKAIVAAVACLQSTSQCLKKAADLMTPTLG